MYADLPTYRSEAIIARVALPFGLQGPFEVGRGFVIAEERIPSLSEFEISRNISH